MLSDMDLSLCKDDLWITLRAMNVKLHDVLAKYAWVKYACVYTNPYLGTQAIDVAADITVNLLYLDK